MDRIGKLAAILALGTVAISAPALAHHSFAMFDQTTLTELKNVTVVQFRWGNPHVFIVVKNDKTTYAVECASPTALIASGWKFNSVKVGDKVSLTIYPLRSGKPGGALKAATLANGQHLGAL